MPQFGPNCFQQVVATHFVVVVRGGGNVDLCTPCARIAKAYQEIFERDKTIADLDARLQRVEREALLRIAHEQSQRRLLKTQNSKLKTRRRRQ